MQPIGLILEGGGMRGLYTAGVLDFFLDKEIELKKIYGVSAGACNAISYITKQRGRNLKINAGFVRDKRYLSFRNFFRTGSIFGMEMLFETIPEELVPFDFEAFAQSDCEMYAGTTDVETGKAHFVKLDDLRNRQYLPLQASMSLPLVSNIVQVDGKKLLDGGIADPIPVDQSIRDGNTKNVVVLTQHREYRKEEDKSLPLLRRKYKEYPHLIEAMEMRHTVYNDTLDMLERMELVGEAFVIRPSEPVSVGRLEKDTQKLMDLYHLGYHDTENCCDKLLRFLEE